MWLCYIVLYAPWSTVSSASRRTCTHGKLGYDVIGSHRNGGMTHSLTHSLTKSQTSASLWGFQISNKPFPLYLASLFSWIFYEPSLCKYKVAKNLNTQNNFTPHAKNMQREHFLSTNATYQHCHFCAGVGFETDVKRCESESSTLTSISNFIFIGHAIRRWIVYWDEIEGVSTPALLEPYTCCC